MTDVYAGRLIEAEDNLDVATRQDDNIRIFFFFLLTGANETLKEAIQRQTLTADREMWKS